MITKHLIIILYRMVIMFESFGISVKRIVSTLLNLLRHARREFFFFFFCLIAIFSQFQVRLNTIPGETSKFVARI